MRGSVSRNHTVNQPRRRSLRLKCISAIYEAKNVEIVDLSSEIQKYGEESDAVVTKQIKVEMLEPEEGNFTCKSSDHVNALPDSAPNEQNLIDITLKDLRERCKAKKRKLLNSVSPLEVDSGSHSSLDESKLQNHEHVNVKQEEPNLDEPLINLKLKRLKGSTTDNKRRKSACLSSDSLIYEEGVTTVSPCLSSDPAQGLPPVMKENASTKDKVSEDDATDLDSKSTVGMCFMEGGNSLVYSVTDLKGGLLGAGIPELSYVKNEIMETCSLDYQIEDDDAVSSILSASLLQKDAEESNLTFLSLHECDEPSSSLSELEQNPHVDSHKYDIVKSEKLENTTLMHKLIFPSTHSTVSFIAKLGCPEESSNNLFESVNEDVRENGEVVPMPSKSPLCYADEASAEYEEPENYASLPEIGEKDLLGMPKQNVIPSVSERTRVPIDCCNDKSICAPMDTDRVNSGSNKKESILPEEITHKSTAEEMDRSAKCHNHELMDVPSVSEHTRVPLDCCNHKSISAPVDTDHVNSGSNKKENILPEEITHESTAEEMDRSAKCHNHELMDIISVSEHTRVPGDCCDQKSISSRMDTDHVNSGSNKKESILPEEITHESTAEEMDRSAKCHNRELMDEEVVCAVNMVNKDNQDLANGIRLQEMPICGKVKDVIDEHNLLCKEVYGLEEIFLSGKEDPCCDDLIHDVAAGCMLCALPFSKTGFSAANELNHANESSTKTDFFSKLENLLNGQAEKGTHFSGTISNLTNSDGLRELDAHSPIAAPPCIGASHRLQCRDDNSLKNTKDLSCAVEEKLDATSNRSAITAISHPAVISKNQCECAQELLVDHTPKKLLSYRKAISPTSQEKLCQALRDIDLHDARRKRLSFEKWTKLKMSSSVLGHKEAEPFLGSEQMNKKPRNHTNSPPSAKKVTLKSQETSSKMPCSCMKTSLVHMEKAIEFSQRQMHDIERLAMQLLKGLNSMKDIVEESLSSEAHPSLPSKFTAEEIRAAAENASELEKTTKKWLSIMTKDCSRFCKIMRSADNKSAAPINGVRKERRITFADEVGGMLCHVKVFEQPSPAVIDESDLTG